MSIKIIQLLQLIGFSIEHSKEAIVSRRFSTAGPSMKLVIAYFVQQF